MRILACLAVLVLLSACNEKKSISIESPDSSLEMHLNLDSKGRAFYRVTKNGQVILQPSQIGIELNARNGKNLVRC